MSPELFHFTFNESFSPKWKQNVAWRNVDPSLRCNSDEKLSTDCIYSKTMWTSTLNVFLHLKTPTAGRTHDPCNHTIYDSELLIRWPLHVTMWHHSALISTSHASCCLHSVVTFILLLELMELQQLYPSLCFLLDTELGMLVLLCSEFKILFFCKAHKASL